MPSLGSLTGIFGKFGKKTPPPPVSQLPETQCTVLPNGMEVWSIYNPNAYTHEFEIGRKTGFLNDPTEFPDITHLEEHLWAHSFPGLNVAALYEYRAVSGLITNFSTSPAHTIISCFSKDVTALLDYIEPSAAAMSRMVFVPEDVEHEKRVIMTENAGKKNASSLRNRNNFFEKIQGFRFDGQDFDVRKFMKISAKDIQQHAAKHMVGENLFALSIGNIPHQVLVEKIRNQLGHLPKGAKFSRPYNHKIEPEIICWEDRKEDICSINFTYNIPTPVENMHTATSLKLFSDVASSLIQNNVRNVLRTPIYESTAPLATDLNETNPKLGFSTYTMPEHFPQCISGIQAGILQIMYGTPDHSIAERIRIARENNAGRWIDDDFKHRIRAGEKPKTIQEQYDALASLSPAKFRQTLKDIVSTPPLIYLSGSLPPAHLRPTPESFTSAFTNVNVRTIVDQPGMTHRP